MWRKATEQPINVGAIYRPVEEYEFRTMVENIKNFKEFVNKRLGCLIEKFQSQLKYNIDEAKKSEDKIFETRNRKKSCVENYNRTLRNLGYTAHRACTLEYLETRDREHCQEFEDKLVVVKEEMRGMLVEI